MLITLLTLGFWAPMRVSWRCCRPPSNPESWTEGLEMIYPENEAPSRGPAST